MALTVRAMLRWHERCESCHKDGRCTSTSDALDFILAFFVFCYHLSDFVVETGGIERETIDNLITNNTHMRICRDVCLRVKHHTISNKKSVERAVDIDWSIGREYYPWPDGTEGWRGFLIADDMLDPMIVVRGCVNFWKELVASWVLQDPSQLDIKHKQSEFRRIRYATFHIAAYAIGVP